MAPAEIAQRTGASVRRIGAVTSHLTRGTYSKVGDAEILDELESNEETTLSLERDLQNWLRRHIGDLEQGLSIIDDGSERRVGNGRIDITARDESGATVVIELKAGTADRDAIGQILHYMGDLMESETRVRGILVAGDFSPRTVAAARAVPNVRYYGANPYEIGSARHKLLRYKIVSQRFWIPTYPHRRWRKIYPIQLISIRDTGWLQLFMTTEIRLNM